MQNCFWKMLRKKLKAQTGLFMSRQTLLFSPVADTGLSSVYHRFCLWGPPPIQATVNNNLWKLDKVDWAFKSCSRGEDGSVQMSFGCLPCMEWVYQPFSIFMGFTAWNVVTSSAKFSDPIVFEFRVKAKVDISVSLEWPRLMDAIVLGADVYSQLSILCIASISICLWLISLLCLLFVPSACARILSVAAMHSFITEMYIGEGPVFADVLNTILLWKAREVPLGFQLPSNNCSSSTRCTMTKLFA